MSECDTCKHRRRFSYQQPCRTCIYEGYGGFPLWEESNVD